MKAVRKAFEYGLTVVSSGPWVGGPGLFVVSGRGCGAVAQRLAHSTAATVPGSNSPGRPNPETGKPMRDPFDLEYDRFNGGAAADAEALWQQRSPLSPLQGPVDIEQEYDRDDPEAVDVNALYDEESPNEEEEILGREVDLDDEYDLMRDHQSSSPLAGNDATATATTNSTATAMRGADPKEMTEDPQTPSEAFKQGVHKFPSDTFERGNKS